MILVRSPLRISLGGGGTDLPSYYEKNEGFLIAASIDKYVYTSVLKPFQNEYIIKYSEYERVKKIDEIKHGIIRESLKYHEFDSRFVEIITLADIPGGTGLGSSSSFACSLNLALRIFKYEPIDKYSLATIACDIELNKLKEPIGKQDQFISAFGGITAFTFMRNGEVNVEPLNMSADTVHHLEDNLLLFFTGYSRKASNILDDQDKKTKSNNSEILSNLHKTKEMGLQSREFLESGNFHNLGELMDEHWQNKKKRSDSMSNPQINEWYDLALRNGAIGGKVVGAGGGGFLLFVTSDPAKLREALSHTPLEEVRFKFDFEGSKVLVS